jgi:hypothetical protein
MILTLKMVKSGRSEGLTINPNSAGVVRPKNLYDELLRRGIDLIDGLYNAPP